MADRLARVDWKMGQTLLPDHFVAQEESLIADSVARWRIVGLPIYGFASLRINPTLLAEGILSLQNVTLVTGTGVLVDVPGNAVISPFNLNVPGTVDVTVYCHLLSSPASSESDMEAGAEADVGRVVRQLVLSSEQSCPDAIETLKLGEFNKTPEGDWALSSRYIPPLLRVGASPFLRDELEQLAESLDGFHYKLSQDIAASFLSGESLFTAKQCLKSVYRTQRFLANLKGEIHPHPYFVYEALKELLTEISFYRSTSPADVGQPYRHDQLGPCFSAIFGPLSEQMQLVRSKSPYIPFELRDGKYRVTLPPEARQAKEAYFLVQKSHVTARVDVDQLKLSSLSRASIMHKLALVGIPLTRIDRPPFQHPFGPEVDFYRMKPGEEWDHALRELSVAFFVAPGLQDSKFFFYWRAGT